MRFALMTEPQMGLTYAEQLAVVQRAEAGGFETFFRSDHYESFPATRTSRRRTPGRCSPASPATRRRIGLGALVSPVTFRTPGNFAKLAVTVDEMSGGRIEVGVGAGWHELEHRRHGFPFPEIGGAGRHARGDARDPARPVGGPGRLVVQGRALHDRGLVLPAEAGVPAGPRGPADPDPHRRPGSPRAYRIAARHADEFNLSSTSPDVATEKYAKLDDACRAIGRDPSTFTHSAMVGLLIGRTDAEVKDARAGDPRRVRGLGRATARSGSTRAARAGSTERLTRRARGSGSSPTRASSGSCSRTSSPAIST